MQHFKRYDERDVDKHGLKTISGEYVRLPSCLIAVLIRRVRDPVNYGPGCLV